MRSADCEEGRLSPIIKWAGGKEQELKYILPNVPKTIESFYEPFVGGGAVYTSIKAKDYFINDQSDELILLYRHLRQSSPGGLFAAIEEIIQNWNLLSEVVKSNSVTFIDTYRSYADGRCSVERTEQRLIAFILENSRQFNGMFSETFNFNTPNFIHELQVNAVRKIKRMKVIEAAKHRLPDSDILDNIESSLKGAFYMHFRHIYNNIDKYAVRTEIQSAIFLFIRNYAYSGMFRYNSSGHFNVPYGGIGYNRKNLQKKIDYLKSRSLQQLLSRTAIENLDFEEFLNAQPPDPNDFVFLDPPYDSEFSTYARNEFTAADQARLATYMLNKCRGRWMLVIKNTPLIRNLYFDKGLNVKVFDKTYLVSFMNRNDKIAEHLLITNY